MKLPNTIKLPISILIPLLAGFLGSQFTTSKIPTWYAGLTKPFFNPPSWVFFPVWTTLYILMGISLYLVWKKGYTKKTAKGINMFLVQISLNTLWSIIFFGLQNPLFAFAEIIALWIAIVLTMCQFKKIDKTAYWLLVPYLAWVSFASILNFSIWILN